MLKKILAVALAAAMIFGLASTAFAASVFPDTAGVSNEAVIARLKVLGIVKGDDLGNFNPNNPINRAEFTAMVVRMLGLENAASYVATPTAFADVKADFSWAYGYINIATGRGLIQGYPDGTFGPAANVTQAEALTILIRALGYNDNLAGTWPIDYVMKGAELGIIATGFSSDVAATRSLIASLVNNTLDENLVKEDADAPGIFLDKYGAVTTLYKDAFGLREAAVADSYLSGLCTVVNTTDLKITIAGTLEDYISGVAVYGKDTVKALEGQYVKATINKDGKISFITVTTKQEVVGDVTAVDTVNSKVTVGGTAYAVLSDAAVYKNTVLLTSTIAGSLTAINETSAKLYLNSDGKVYRIEASVLDQGDMTIRSKQSLTTIDGVKNYVFLGAADPGTKYEVASTTTVVRNGASDVFANLKTGDDVKFSATATDGTGKLVYLDAWAQVIKGYKVVSVGATASGYSLVLSKDGVNSTYTSSITANPNETYDFTLNRDGKIIAKTAVSTDTPELDETRKVASKSQEYANSAIQYKVTFEDGSVLTLNNMVLTHVVGGVTTDSILRRNGNAITTATAAGIWAALQVGDKVTLTENETDDAVQDLWAFSETVTGRIGAVAIVGGHTVGFELWKHDTSVAPAVDTKLGTFELDWQSALTLNGVRKVTDEIVAAPASPFSSLYTATVTLTGKSGATGTAMVGAITAERFLDGVVAGGSLPIKSVSVAGTTYTVTLDANAAGADPTFLMNSDTIVTKDGVAATLADVIAGNRALVNVAAGATAPFVKASTDTTKPSVNNDGTFTLTNATWVETDAVNHLGTLGFKINFTNSEACQAGYVWYNGVRYTATEADGVWTATISIANVAHPATDLSITAVGVDYAGNASDGVTKSLAH